MTVEEWVATLPGLEGRGEQEGSAEQEREQERGQERGQEVELQEVELQEQEDTLSLGAEAVQEKKQVRIKRDREQDGQSRRRGRSEHSDTLTSTNSQQSFGSKEEILQSREADPQQVAPCHQIHFDIFTRS